MSQYDNHDVREGVGSSWVNYLKTISWIAYIGIVIAGIAIGQNFFSNAFLGIIAGIVVGLIVGAAVVGGTMVLLNAAENILQTTTNTAAIYELLLAKTPSANQGGRGNVQKVKVMDDEGNIAEKDKDEIMPDPVDDDETYDETVDDMPKVKCAGCGKYYDLDYPKCPLCKTPNNHL